MDDIDLGFAEERERASLWLVNRYFPNKVGGKPAWLELASLPSKEQLFCVTCQHPKAFLCQIYAPFDNEHNFHRTIFVFICRTAACQIPNSSANVTVLRSQLSRKNQFYSEEPPEEEGEEPLEEIPTLVKLCCVCGCPGPFKCGRCRNEYNNYCSPHHQRAHWHKYHKKLCLANLELGQTIWQAPILELVFPEWEIVIERYDEGKKMCAKKADKKTDEESRLSEFQQLSLEGKTGSLKNIPDSELEKYAGSSANNMDDKQFRKFKKEISEEPEQIIRYKRGGNPLWIADVSTISSQLQIPKCENCGAERHFEFQIMPQMLLLLKDDNLDWGTLAIYSCSLSCQFPTNIGYLPEYVIKQDILNNKL